MRRNGRFKLSYSFLGLFIQILNEVVSWGKMLYLVSDESGDRGVFDPTAKKPGSSRLYTSFVACLLSPEAITKLGIAGVTAARKIFDPPHLRQWKKLKSKVKRNPEVLSSFFADLLNNFLEQNNKRFIAAFSIVDKAAIQAPHQSKQANMRIIEASRLQVYEMAFKRIKPMLKKYHFISRRYPSPPTIKWYLDVNSGRFQSSLNEVIQRNIVEENLDVSLQFVSKKRRDGGHDRIPHIREAITVVDILAGICTKSFENHLLCQQTNGADDCAGESPSTCSNDFRTAWELINKNVISNIHCKYQEATFWEWHGMMYIPIGRRHLHTSFLGQDPYVLPPSPIF